jgi:hypothetical protein
MDIYLAVITSAYEESIIVGAFSTMELAKAAFPIVGLWVRGPGQYENQWWQRETDNPHGGLTGNEIHVLTLDRPMMA